jgi:5-methylcytosine-specific restriction endonuclease McrA
VEFIAKSKEVELPHSRLIPTAVKLEVWARDKGQCVLCGSKENLHFDHDLPFSKGGTSLTADNVRILCMRHNLKKSNKLLTIPPIFLS